MGFSKYCARGFPFLLLDILKNFYLLISRRLKSSQVLLRSIEQIEQL